MVSAEQESPSKRGMHRAHDFLTNPPWPSSRPRATNLRHHISPTAFRGRKVVKAKGE